MSGEALRKSWKELEKETGKGKLPTSPQLLVGDTMAQAGLRGCLRASVLRIHLLQEGFPAQMSRQLRSSKVIQGSINYFQYFEDPNGNYSAALHLISLTKASDSCAVIFVKFHFHSCEPILMMAECETQQTEERLVETIQ